MIAIRYLLIPQINAARDAMTGGNREAKARFDRLHRLSVMLNLIEMVTLAAVIVLLLRSQ